MAKTQLHDIEICIEDGWLKIIPYKLQIQYHDRLTPLFVADTSTSGQSRMFRCKLNKENHSLIAHILDLDEWEMRGDWDGFSEWNTTEYLDQGETPERIKKWLQALPSYELKLKAFTAV